MANTDYVRENRITRELARDCSRRRKNVAYIGLPLALAASALYPAGVLLWFGMVGLLLLAAGYRDNAKVSGAAGENYSLAILKQLPDSYTIFYQVCLPDPWSSTGERELDFIVCGPNGVFVVESKSHNGVLEGGPDDRRWTIHKVGRGGTAYRDTVRNPIRQVRQQVHLLSAYLKNQGVRVWVTGAVALSRDNSLERVDGGGIPLIPSTDLAAFLLAHRPDQPPRESHIAQSIRAIAALVG